MFQGLANSLANAFYALHPLLHISFGMGLGMIIGDIFLPSREANILGFVMTIVTLMFLLLGKKGQKGTPPAASSH